MAHMSCSDVGAVAREVLLESSTRHASKYYDLTGTESVSFTRVAEIMSQVFGFQVTYFDLSVDDYGAQLKQFGLPDWIWDNVLHDFYEIIRAGQAAGARDTQFQFTGQSVSLAKFFEQNKLVFTAAT